MSTSLRWPSLCLGVALAAMPASAQLTAPFSNVTVAGDAMYTHSGTGTFVLTALIILLAALATGLALLAWFAPKLKPAYGARVKYNVLTGRVVYRDAAMRTLPTPEERAEQERQQQQQRGGPRVHSMPTAPFAAQQAGQTEPNRLGQVCPRGCSDSFWCPPCLLSCSCLDCLWCGPRVCCGAHTFGEWLFARVYRAPAARWFALVGQMCLLGLSVLALVLDRWSRDAPSGSNLVLYAGVLGVRVEEQSVSYSCSGLEGDPLQQCNILRVGSGCVLALGILAGLLMLASITWSIRLRFSLPERAYTPGLSLLSIAYTFVVAILLLLWPLVPHMVLKDVYDSSLGLGESWGIFFIQFFLGLILAAYMRGQVECVSVSESQDPEAMALEAADRAARERMERRLNDPYGLDLSLGASQANVLVLGPGQMELAERRAEAAGWTVDGYGGAGGEGGASPLSPLAAYAAGSGGTLRNPLGTLTTPLGSTTNSSSLHLSGPLPTVQRPYHANEPIPVAEVLEPSPEELERRAWELEREKARRMQEANARRNARSRTQMSGPYTASAPVIIDVEERDRRAAQAAMARQNEDEWGVEGGMASLQDNGLSPAQQQALFGDSGIQKPRSLYSYYANEPERPVRIERDPNSLDATFTRAAANEQEPAHWHGRAVIDPGTHDDAEGSAMAMPSPPNPIHYTHLDPAFVRNALPLDEYDLAMLAEDEQQTKRGAQRGATISVRERPQSEAQQRQPPLTPKQYREAVELERISQPNLLTPASSAQMHPQRLPPLQHPAALEPLPPAFGRSGPQVLIPVRGAASPHYTYGHTAAPSYGAHPFILESPHSSQQREMERSQRLHHQQQWQQQAAWEASERERHARVYTYGRASSQLSTQRSEFHFTRSHVPSMSNLPSVSSRGDVHFVSTLSPHHLQSQLASTQQLQWQQQQQQQSQQQQRFPPPSFDPAATSSSLRSHPATPHHAPHPSLSIQIQSSDDPLSRTIPTPLPVLTAQQVADMRADEHDEAHDVRDASYVRRVPLAPQTPRLVTNPQSATVLRQTPRGPYSRAFGN